MGDSDVRFGDDEHELLVGDVVWVPRGQAHSFGTGSEPAKMLQTDTPRALDAYFRDLAVAFPRGTRPDPTVVGEIMSRHDTRPLEPGPSTQKAKV